MKKKQHFKLSPGQNVLWNAWMAGKAQTYLASAGEQGGKTFLGALLFKEYVKKDQKKNYIVGFPTYKVGEQATKPAFLARFKGLGRYAEKDDLFTLNGGGQIYLRSAKDPDSVIGITNCQGAWLDEAGKCPRMFYYNIQSRVSRMKGRILLTTSPYAWNWVQKEVIQPASEGDQRFSFARWASVENPSYPKDQFDRLKAILPPRIFRMRLEGFHDRAEGLIFEDWGPKNLCKRFSLSPELHVVGGCDWGFDHPLALSIRAFTPDHLLYGVSYFKRSGLSTTQQLDLIESKTRVWNVKTWYCGHDRPDMIAELKKRRINAVKYFEHSPDYREVNAGNQKHAELIRSLQYRAFEDAEQLADLEDEYSSYVWEKKEEGEETKKEKPININDDLMAAERYATVGLIPLLTRKEKFPMVKEVIARVRDAFRPTQVRKDWDAF